MHRKSSDSAARATIVVAAAPERDRRHDHTLPRFDTHEVFNQSPPYEDVDLFRATCRCRSGRGERRGRRGGGARRLRPAMGHGRDVRARRGAPMRTRRSSTPSTPRAFAATWSSSIRPITSSCARASRRACMPRPGRPTGTRAAPPAEVARAARYLHGGAGRERAPVPDHHDARGAGGARRRAGAARASRAEDRSRAATIRAFRPWWEKRA